MAYKRYIKKGGKIYGPYIYHSHKKDGKVVSEYLGKHKEKKKLKDFFKRSVSPNKNIFTSVKDRENQKRILSKYVGKPLDKIKQKDVSVSSVKVSQNKMYPSITWRRVKVPKISPFIKKPADLNLNLQKRFLFLGLVGLFLLLFAAFFINIGFTGKVSSDITTNYQVGELLKGTLNFNLKAGELIPADSKVIVSLGNSTLEYFLSELVNENITSGDFYAEGVGVLGEGMGYGVVGSKKIYPNVTFQLEILDGGLVVENETIVSETKENESGSTETEILNETENQVQNETVVSETESVDESAEEVGSEAVTEESEEVQVSESEGQEVVTEEEVKVEKEVVKEEKEVAKEEKKEAKEEKKSEEVVTSLITGEAISDYSDIVTGTASKGNDFEYGLSVTKDAELVSGSVVANGEVIDDDSISVKNQKDKVVVSTKYSYEGEGFGEEYLSNKPEVELGINLEDFNLSVNEEGDLYIYLVYDDNTIAEVSEHISLIDKIPEGIENMTEINETIVNETEILNETIVVNASAENISTIQYGAVLGKPVKWKKIISDDDGKINVEIPIEAENVTVYKMNEMVPSGDEENESEVIEEETNETGVNESLETNVSEENDVKILNETIIDVGTNETGVNESSEKVSEQKKEKKKTMITAQVVSGKVSAEIDLENKSPPIIEFFKNLFSRITGRAIDVAETEDTKEVVIDENATEFEIEYVTPGPVAFEENTSRGKAVTISSNVHYENILAYTELPYPVPEWQIRLYHVENGSRVLTEFIGYSDEEDQGAKDSLDNLTSTDGDEVVNRINPLENVTCEFNNETNSTDCYSVNCEFNNETNLTECVNESEVNGEVIRSEKLISYIEWVVPHLSNETYELELSILNVQSYPTVGGNWTVRFNTTGEANLTISAFNGTTYGFEGQTSIEEICVFNEATNETICEDVESPIDLEYLETKCGDETLDVFVRINGIEVPYEIYLQKKRIEEIRRELG